MEQNAEEGLSLINRRLMTFSTAFPREETMGLVVDCAAAVSR